MVGIDRSKMKLYDVADDASAISINDEDPGEDFQQFADTQSRFCLLYTSDAADE